MRPIGDHHFAANVEGVRADMPYWFRVDGKAQRPDPASRSQRDGVHGPSRIVDLQFDWRDGSWRGLPLSRYVIYELHVGTFSREGTFDGVAAQLARLRELGVTAIELMPVAQFPGSRNWGYDGVYPFAVQDSYGGPRGLQRLVDACHRAGLGVLLDVVYNHLGPEGNYLGEYGDYFTEAYRTPWGAALNFDGPDSEGVRRFFLQNALQWVEHFHIDALRLDAVHAIIDRSAKPFLEELAERVHERAEELGRHAYLIAESDLNDPRVVRPSELGGHGLDAMWCDDFHHAAHSLITGETRGYYEDFGRVAQLARAFETGMSCPGQYSPYRRRRHGRAADDLRPRQVVVCLQNHDQVGNRLLGERLSALVSFEQQKLAAGLVCLAPFIPLLFMGEEYGETAPFQYFVSHGDPALVEAVRQGRREEFRSFGCETPAPDPAATDTFERCILQPELRESGQHAKLHAWYRALLALRPSLAASSSDRAVAVEDQKVLLVQRGSAAFMLFSFSSQPLDFELPVGLGSWHRLLASSDESWGGPGTPMPAMLESNGRARGRLQPHSLVCYRLAQAATSARASRG
jgi:maltooligosyltrehalose trehalohydrolase